jgi:hypothetical protein
MKDFQFKREASSPLEKTYSSSKNEIIFPFYHFWGPF